MMLACAMTGTGGGEWTALAFIGVPLLGLLIGSRLLSRRSSGVHPPSAPPARAELPPFPLAAVPELGSGSDAAGEKRLDEPIGV
jgi:hypothetical protein